MGLHRNARLGLAGRRALIADIEAGCSCREAARRRGVSPSTACKWWRRWSRATESERTSGRCLEDRSSRPHRCPRLLSLSEQRRICAARRRTGWGPRLLAGETGHPHATVWRTLRRAGISRSRRQLRERPRLKLYRHWTWGRPLALRGGFNQLDPTPLEVIPMPGHSPDHHVVFDCRMALQTSDYLALIILRE